MIGLLCYLVRPSRNELLEATTRAVPGCVENARVEYRCMNPICHWQLRHYKGNGHYFDSALTNDAGSLRNSGT